MKPILKVNGQYIKDFSFENPNAPKIFFNLSKVAPNIQLSISVSSSQLSLKEESSDFYCETTLHILAEGKVEKDIAFVCDLKYAGVFLIENRDSLEDEEIKLLMYVTAPVILFPFAREIIAKATVNAGFPPLSLDIIDFQKMYDEAK